MPHYRTAIFYDNIDHISERLANFFNKYTDPHIIDWCQHNHIIANNTTNILKSKDHDFKRFIDAVTNRSIDPTKLTLTDNIQKYEQILHNRTSLGTFMKFVLGLTYLLDPSRHLSLSHIKDIYPFIGITYFIYDKINYSPLLNDSPNDKEIILRDIRNLWTMFLFRKTNSHTNLRDEWDVLFHETQHPVSTDSSKVNLTPAFNIISPGSARTSAPLSVYIQNSLIQALNDAIVI